MSRRVLALLVVLSALFVFTGCENLTVRMKMVEGNKHYKAQDYDKAIASYKEILQVQPDNFMATYLIAISNLAQYHPGSQHPKDVGYANESLAYFEKALNMKPPSPDWTEKLEKYYLSLLSASNQEAKAIAFLEKERAKKPNNVGIISQLATYYAKTDFNKALDAFQKIAQMEPTKEHWYTVGVVCWERSYKGGAQVSDDERVRLIGIGQDALKKAIAIDPTYFEAWAYVNLLHREMAKVASNRQDLETYTREMALAEEAKNKAVAISKAKKEEAAKEQASGSSTTTTK